MSLTERNPVCDRNPKLASTRDPIRADAAQDDCCCVGGPPPPPPRPRYVAAILCNPTLHTLHPEIPLYVYISADSICPGRANPVFKHHFICYHVGSFDGPFFVQCTPANPTPDPGTTCLPPDAVFGQPTSGCWADCSDDRCTKFIVFGSPCASCMITPPDIACAYADVRDLAIAMGGEGFPTGCVVMAIDNRCYTFSESSATHNIEDVPDGCGQGTRVYCSCCECAWENNGAGRCLACFVPVLTCDVDPKDDGWKSLLCPPQRATGKCCCCGPGSQYTSQEDVLTVQRHSDGSVSYTRDHLEATYPGNFHWHTEESNDGVTYHTTLDYTLTTGTVCGWFQPWCDMYRPSCPGDDPNTRYTAYPSGDCNNLVFSWVKDQTFPEQPGESLHQDGTITINGTPGAAGCNTGCGDVAGPGLAQLFVIPSPLEGCADCGGYIPNVPEVD